MHKYLVINLVTTIKIKEKLEKFQKVGFYITDSNIMFLIRFMNLWEIY